MSPSGRPWRGCCMPRWRDTADGVAGVVSLGGWISGRWPGIRWWPRGWPARCCCCRRWVMPVSSAVVGGHVWGGGGRAGRGHGRESGSGRAVGVGPGRGAGVSPTLGWPGGSAAGAGRTRRWPVVFGAGRWRRGPGRDPRGGVYARRLLRAPAPAPGAEQRWPPGAVCWSPAAPVVSAGIWPVGWPLAAPIRWCWSAGGVRPRPGWRCLAARVAGRGAHARITVCDVTDRAAVAGVLAGINAGPFPLTAVMHAAAVLDDGVIDGLDASRLAVVARPR